VAVVVATELLLALLVPAVARVVILLAGLIFQAQ
jgi:hypothetical protein